ncbi:MAG: hypothetical protein WBF04_20225 [Candidatus Sulfotelmatobacter sp.]
MTFPSARLRTLREEQSRRRLEVARLVRDTPNVTDVELAKALNVSRNTIREDRLALMAEVNQDAKSEFQIWRGEHIEELRVLREQLQDFLIPPEKRIELALAIIREDSKIKGTAAATRSENINVHLDGDAIGPYRQFVLASRGLDAEQVEQLLTLAREMPRKPFVQVAPPKSSPLWDVPQLTEGTDEDA